MKAEVISYFSIQESQTKMISKEEIDEANIIYRYINSHASECLIIPDQWLEPDRTNKIKQAILHLMV